MSKPKSNGTPCIFCGSVDVAARINAYPELQTCMLCWMCMPVDPLMIKYAAYRHERAGDEALLSFDGWKAATYGKA